MPGCLYQKFVAIPKSVSQARIEANAQIFDFELDDEDMKQVSDRLTRSIFFLDQKT
jgi:diketogulonate reductase-like aldo/keto reductase